MKGKFLAALGGALLLAAVICGFLFLPGPTNTPALGVNANFDIKAEKETAAGVDPDSDFIITSDSELSAADLKSIMTLSPELEYDLRVADGGYKLQPEGLLEPNTLYNISIQQGQGLPELSWAFQTQDKFMVTKSFPGNESTDVPVNTGIEITFSQEVEDIASYLVIEPAVEGAFETHGKTVAFVPKEALADDTVYTVALKAGLPSKAGEKLAESHIFAFRTSAVWEESEQYGYSSNQFWVLDFTESFLPQDPVPISIYADNRFDGSQFTLDLYRLKDADAYLTLAQEQQEHVNPVIGRNDDYMLSVDGLEKVQSFTDQYHREYDSTWYPGYFVLPENPGAGWYLLDINGVDQQLHGQKLIQISDGAVYAQSMNGVTLVWVNDAVSGKPASGASVILDTETGQLQGTTDGNGIVELETGEAEIAALKITSGDKTFADLLRLTPAEEQPLSNSYYTFIYTDREAYQPTDTVKLWGFVLPRTSGVELPSSLTLQYEGLNQDGVTVDVNSDGSFSTEVSFENRVSGYWNFQFLIGEKDLASKSILIMEYKKPVYTFTLTNDKPYYRYGDAIRVDVAATFFDGTPAAGITLSTYPEGSLTTDQNGKAAFSIAQSSYRGRNGYFDGWRPFYETYSVNTTGTEDENTYASGEAVYFPSDYMLEVEKIDNSAGDSCKLELQANKILFDQLSTDLSIYEQTENLRGEGAVLSGNIELHKTTYVKKEVGEYYDYINKITVKRYEYDPVTTLVQEISFKTDANGRFTTPDIAYPQEENSYYEAIVSFTSPQAGNPKIRESVYIGSHYYPNDEQEDYYTLQPENYEAKNTVENGVTPLYLNNQGEQVENKGQVLCITAQDKMLALELTSEDQIDFVYKAEYIPNCFISGAYFDGKHIYALGTSYLNFDPSERMLNIELTTDQQSYRPGDTVTVTAKVTDLSGKPVKAALLLSVADEAAFAIQQQNLNVLTDLYQSIYWYPRSVYGSYKQHTMESAANDAAGAAEGGGDSGSDAMRREFLDTAAFLPTETDRNGMAEVTFTLPDNLTSWRVSGIAYTKEAFAGSGISNVRSTLEFFLNPVIGTQYLTGDDITLSLRAAGTAINANTEVAYQVTLKGGAADGTTTYQGKAGEFTFCNLGKLPAGSYTLEIRGSAGEYQDGVEQTFQVVDSMKELPISKMITPEEIPSIRALKYPVRLFLFDQENALYFQTLGNLLSQNGNRADQRLARAIAEARLVEFYGKEGEEPETALLSDLQSWDGGIRLLPYADSEPELTAWVCAIGSDFIDKEKAKEYLYGLLQDAEATQSNVAYAYMGLAALKEPVLYDLRQLVAESNDWSLQDRMTLALSLSLAGDQTGARQWYQTNVLPKVKTNAQWAYIEGEDGYALTAQAAALALHSQDETGYQLLRYLLDNPSAEQLTAREQLLYLEAYQPKQAQTATYEYVLDGETVSGDFEENSVVLLSLNAAELKNLNLKATSGRLGIMACYTGNVTEIAQDTGTVSVSKQYAATIGLGGNAAKVTISVTFADDAPMGWYTLTDIVPAGARFTKADYGENNQNWYFYQQEMQRLSFSLFRNQQEDGSKTKQIDVTYYIRGILPGTYQVEGAVVQHDGMPAASYSPSGSITIGE